MRRTLGYPYWSLSAYLKARTKRAVQYMGEFEAAVSRRGVEEGVDGVVCGHIHRPELRTFVHDGQEVLYANCGDWVESCTALAEHADGTLELLRWTPEPQGDGQTHPAASEAPVLASSFEEVPHKEAVTA